MRDARRLSSFAALLFCFNAPALATSYLGSAANFAVLGAATVTNTGATIVKGDIGVSPGTAITGLGTVALTGSVHAGDPVAAQAHADAVQGAADLAALAFNTNLSGTDLGTLGALTPGIYRFASSAQLTGTLTLDFSSAPNSAFVFQIGSTLTTATGANVIVIGGGSGSGIYWNVGTAATLGIGTNFAGNILAQTAITLASTSRIVCGRAISLTTAVTLDTNIVSNDCRNGGDFGTGRPDFGSGGFIGNPGTVKGVPEPAVWAMLLLGFGASGAALRHRRAVAA